MQDGFDLLARADILVENFKVLRLIGRGGMGAVYKARQRALDRLVAIKVLPPEGQENPEFGERFLREAQALIAQHFEPDMVLGIVTAGDWVATA